MQAKNEKQKNFSEPWRIKMAFLIAISLQTDKWKTTPHIFALWIRMEWKLFGYQKVFFTGINLALLRMEKSEKYFRNEIFFLAWTWWAWRFGITINGLPHWITGKFHTARIELIVLSSIYRLYRLTIELTKEFFHQEQQRDVTILIVGDVTILIDGELMRITVWYFLKALWWISLHWRNGKYSSYKWFEFNWTFWKISWRRDIEWRFRSLFTTNCYSIA